jgi:type IV secretion system protein VirB4
LSTAPKKWLGSLLVKKDEPLSAYEEKQVSEVIDRSYTLAENKRTLSVIASFFPTDFSRLDHLAPWLRAVCADREDGRLAYLFDNPNDNLHLGNSLSDVSIAGFDMTHLLNSEPQEVIFSVMLYLFHRIEALMKDNGQLVGIYLDEGWQLLDNPYWAQKMKAYLATLRKKNAFIVFTTQSPHTVATSPLRSALIEGTATNIFLPNEKAESADYIDGFKLSKGEYHFIKNTPAHERRFLIKQGHEVAIGRLNLSGLGDYRAVLSGNEDTIQLASAIRKTVGEDPAVWLPIFYARRPR